MAVAAAAVVAFSGAVLLEPSSKRRWLLSGEKKRPEGFDWILLSQNSGSENRSERSRTNRVARDRGSKVQFCAPCLFVCLFGGVSKAGEIRTLPKTSLPVAVLRVAKGRIP